MGTSYHVYANAGDGGPIDYATPIGTTTSLTFQPPALNPSSVYRFGVRAFDDVTGQEETNVDAVVTIITDAAGNDITNRPAPPLGLTATPVKGGGIRVTWNYSYVPGSVPLPTGFHVYVGIGTPNYASVAATVVYSSVGLGFSATLMGLVSGTTYAIGARTYNGVAEETNTTVVSATADSLAPASVRCLQGFPVSS